MYSQRRLTARVAVMRPFPQLRIIRSYGVSPLKSPRMVVLYRFRSLDPETSNFTYDIANRRQLVVALASALRAPRELAHLLPTSIGPPAGYFVHQLSGPSRIVIGDVRQYPAARWTAALSTCFEHDSLHTYQHEPLQLEIIHGTRRRQRGDCNQRQCAHATTALADFAAEVGAAFVLFHKQPAAALPARGR